MTHDVLQRDSDAQTPFRREQHYPLLPQLPGAVCANVAHIPGCVQVLPNADNLARGHLRRTSWPGTLTGPHISYL